MVKYIALLIVALAIASRFWYNRQVASGTHKHADGLKKGKFNADSFDDVLNIKLENKEYANSPDGFKGFAEIAYEKKIKYNGRYEIMATSLSGSDKAVIIARVKTKKDTQYSKDKLDLVLPCSLLIVHDGPGKTINYYSEFPADGEHESLLREFISQVHSRLV